MSQILAYDKYFRIVTVRGDDGHSSGVGVEQYNPLDQTHDCVIWFASIYLERGGRSQAVRKAIRAIETQVSEGDKVAIRLGGRNWWIWRHIFHEQYKITKLKGRTGWAAELAYDALDRKTTIIDKLKENTLVERKQYEI